MTERWNIFSLKKYFDLALLSLESKIDLRFALGDKALEKAETANTHRLESMNEIREQLNTQAATFLRKDEYTASNKFIVQKIDNLSKIVYIGLGVFLFLQIVLVFTLTLLFKV